MTLRTQNIQLPVGNKASWELNNDHEDNLLVNGRSPGLKSVADSFVILQSLKQSRDKWMTGSFPKFSSKPRGGKAPETIPPPHTHQIRGKCSFEIGPHTFPDTVIFEVHYHSAQDTSQARQAYLYHPPSTSNSSWQATTPYGGLPYAPYGQRPEPAKFSSASEASISQPRTSTPLLSSLTSSVSITPALVSQVNSAAASNPTLANLLQLAAAGKANPDQLKSLGLLIQSLAGNQIGDESRSSTPVPGGSTQPETSRTAFHSTGSQSIPTTSASLYASSSQHLPQTYVDTAKEFDLVIEFHEASADRWIFPRGPAVCERMNASDIVITTIIPYSQTRAPIEKGLPGADIMGSKKGAPEGHDSIPQVVSFLLRKASPVIWDTVLRWAGGEEKMATSRHILEALEPRHRVFLAHQLPEGSMLTQVQNAATPSFNTKPIKPVLSPPSLRPKRNSTPRKPRIAGDPPITAPTSKRKRPPKQKPSSLMPLIACRTCGQVNVPLILGGLFCRPCVDAGKGPTDLEPLDIGAGFSYKSPHAGIITPEVLSVTPTTAAPNSRIIPRTSAPAVFKASPLATSPPILPNQAMENHEPKC